jgi:hypothetical protein
MSTLQQEQEWIEGGSQCQTNTWTRGKDGKVSPTHKHKDGSWWFYDETWKEEFGPFTTKEKANQGCEDYANTL